MISDIQKEILRLALEKKFITCEELLLELWGQGSQERLTIDKALYASAHASLSRTLTRLWKRDLITYWKTLTRYRTGISLTAAGKTLAQAILAEAEKEQING